jgi:hypothetical protein
MCHWHLGRRIWILGEASSEISPGGTWPPWLVYYWHLLLRESSGILWRPLRSCKHKPSKLL